MSRCPSSQQLEQLLDEQLDEGESSVITQHVSDCPRCQAALEQLTAGADAVTDSVSAVLRQQVHGRSATLTEPLGPFLERLKGISVQSSLSALRADLSEATAAQRNGPRAPKPGVPMIPGYEILGELGRGGMGVVYKARQLGLSRLVALKMILAGPHAGPKELARFRQEAEAVARLHHPNIVQIHDIGEADGIPYFALEFVEGGSLVQRLRGDPQPIPPTVRLIETLARAVHFAHQHRVVHRDLKPANILLAVASGQWPVASEDRDSSGSPATDHWLLTNVPKITDFGLAKRLDQQSTGTQTGEVVGTPSYMAPEQTGSKAHLIGPATDVYALGAILYEMLTGRPPFKGATALDTVVHLLHVEPVRPSGLRPHLPRDLETICLKCLEKEPHKRYASAEALADDLRCFRSGKPIQARPVGRPERAWKWARRRPLSAALLAGMLLFAVLGFAGITWQWHEATAARDTALAEKREKENERLQAEYARAEAEAQRKRARMALYYSRITQSQLQWRVNDVAGAVESLAKCLPLADQPDRRGWEWYYLQGLFHSDLFTLHHLHGGDGGCAAYHPDGRTIASVVGGHPTEDDANPGEVRIWDALRGALLHSLPVPGTVHRLAFRPDGKQLVLATTDGQVMFRDAASGKEILRATPHAQSIAGLAFSPDGRQLACASWDQTVKICDVATGQTLRTLQGHTGRVQAVAFHSDGKRLASGSWDATVRIWDVRTGQELLTLRGHKSPVSGVAFSPDGELLASSGSNGNLRIWEMATGRVIQSLTARSGTVLGNSFSPDGRYLAYSGGDATVRVWDVESGVERVVFRGHAAAVESVQFSPDGQRLVSASPVEAAVKVWDLTRHPEQGTFARVRGRADQVVKVHDLTGRSEAVELARTGPDIEALAFQADGRRLVSVAVGGNLQTWDAQSGMLEEQRSLAMSDELITPAVLAAFGPGGQRLAARAREDERLVKIWDVASGAETVVCRGHTLPVFCVGFSPDGRWLISCGCDIRRADRPHEIIVWNAATGARLATLKGHGLVLSARFSPDGRWAALGVQDGAVLLADWAGAAHQVMRVAVHKGPVAAVAFSADGRLLASAGVEDKTLKIWDWDVPRRAFHAVHTLAAPLYLCDLAFSPDNRRLAGISRDVVKMWDVAMGQEVLTLRGAGQRHWDPAFNPRVAFSPNGKRLAGTNWNESISLWAAEVQAGETVVAEHQTARREAADARAGFWHLQEAEDCLEHHNRAAALFHLQRLRNAALPRPLQERKQRLETQLND